MLETYFIAPKTLRHLRSGPSGPYIDGFATCLKSERYTHAVASRYLRSATHLGHFVASQGHTLGEVTQQTLYALQDHLPSWRCPQSNGGHVNHLNARTMSQGHLSEIPVQWLAEIITGHYPVVSNPQKIRYDTTENRTDVNSVIKI